jgi:hypothetical protein
MLVVLALSLVMHATPSSLEVPPDAPPHTRVERFMGALLGGAAGLAASALLLSLTDSCGFSSCSGSIITVIGAPFVMAAGAMGGYTLMGGSVGFGTTLGSLTFGLAGVSLLSFLAQSSQSERSFQLMLPYVLGGFLVADFLLAAAMVFREDSVTDGGRDLSASAVRISLTILANALAATASFFLVAGLVLLSPVLGIIGTAVFGFAIAATDFGIHAALGGRGGFLAALGGVLTAGAMTMQGALVLSAAGRGVNNVAALSGNVDAVLAAGLAAVFLPALCLELDDTGKRQKAILIGAAPIPHGAMLSAGVQF